ncbi:hypothetical protein NHX12_029506 [Muraenolepis orangiensis]|uniref:Uncharacterized protein n=1 Tax=Muraenolepis orangiensis TaxID=630683 RepID=A0A9Q0D8U3_9TELE|nr:hypothetical protein NHX12_029506 [Muraenolepis orangiensis]
MTYRCHRTVDQEPVQLEILDRTSKVYKESLPAEDRTSVVDVLSFSYCSVVTVLVTLTPCHSDPFSLFEGKLPRRHETRPRLENIRALLPYIYRMDLNNIHGSAYPVRLSDQFFGAGMYRDYPGGALCPYCYRRSLFRNWLNSTTLAFPG